MGRGGMLVELAQTLRMSLVSRRGTLVGGVGVEGGEGGVRRVGGSNGVGGVGDAVRGDGRPGTKVPLWAEVACS